MVNIDIKTPEAKSRTSYKSPQPKHRFNPSATKKKVVAKPTKTNKKSKKKKKAPVSHRDDYSSFVPTQTKLKRGKDTQFEVIEVDEDEHPEMIRTGEYTLSVKSPEGEPIYEEEEYEDREEETKIKYEQSKTWYYTTHYNYPQEMTQRIERHHKETVRNPNKMEFVKPYLNKVHGSYYTGKGMQQAYYDPKTISSQEFIDRAYYDVCVRGYLRHRKQYRLSYPLYGENLHGESSSNRVIMHYPDHQSTKNRIYSTRKSLEAAEA